MWSEHSMTHSGITLCATFLFLSHWFWCHSWSITAPVCTHWSFVIYVNITDGLLRISQEEGLSSLWSGTGPSLVLAGNPAIQFMVYEAIKKFLMHEDKQVLNSVNMYFSISVIYTESNLFCYIVAVSNLSASLTTPNKQQQNLH